MIFVERRPLESIIVIESVIFVEKRPLESIIVIKSMIFVERRPLERCQAPSWQYQAPASE